MGKTIPFGNQEGDDLNALLERARILKKFVVDSEDEIVKDFGAIERIFEGKISEILIDSKLISKGFFLCGIYVSKMLRDFVFTCPESWYAIDYIEMARQKGNPYYFKDGADMCFLLCSLFAGRTNRRRRATSKKMYIEIGGGLYYRFFSETKHNISRHMARNFETMVDVANEAVGRIRR
ncbi:MAG: hypothetical protein V1825_02630 [Candidatus Falkowbacteria bacterium]